MQNPRLIIARSALSAGALSRNTFSGVSLRCAIRYLNISAPSRSCTLLLTESSSWSASAASNHERSSFEVVVHNVVEHAPGAVDFMHAFVLGEHGIDSVEIVPFVTARRPVANHLQDVIRVRRGEGDGDGAGAAGCHSE